MNFVTLYLQIGPYQLDAGLFLGFFGKGGFEKKHIYFFEKPSKTFEKPSKPLKNHPKLLKNTPKPLKNHAKYNIFFV